MTSVKFNNQWEIRSSQKAKKTKKTNPHSTTFTSQSNFMQSARDLSTAEIREWASSSSFMVAQNGWGTATVRLTWGFTGIEGRL